MEKTLEEQFKFLNKEPFPDVSEGLKKCYNINSRTILYILKYIVDNNCILEHRSNLDKEDWKVGTIREFISYAIDNHGDKKNNPTGDSWMLKFWRIKTNPSEKELYWLTHIKKESEL